ncbi:F0F1 ATP synthase subunit A [bacterium]|jgi:F-type H+-transporting ATPase subunit a|nr:F0F1 ATP synthase subunit A [bacterium]
MKPIEIFKYTNWKPFEYLGIHGNFYSIHAETIISTWVVLGIILVAAIVSRHFLKKQVGVGNYLVVSFGQTFIDLCNQILGNFKYKYFAFITSIFCFILLCNCISLIPWLDEPTQDLNTTVAMGIIAIAYTHIQSVKVHGLWEYIKEYFSPFILMFPLNIVGKLANVVSISFRLFGNIFGGAIISQIYHNAVEGSILLESIGILSTLDITVKVFFGLFEGFIQAFVFSMLTLTYLSVAIQKDTVEKGNV